MAKFKNLLTNLFPKSSLKLETDAAVVPQRSDSNDSDKNESHNNVQAAAATEGASSFPSTSFVQAEVAVVPANSAQQLLNPDAGTLTQNFVNNVQNNTLTAPQTSITNTAGVQVYQIKNAKNVHIGNCFSFNSANSGEDRTKVSNGNIQVKWANLKLSDTIRQMMECLDDMDTEMMDTVSRHLGYEWKSFARTLEYSEGQIEAFESDNNTLSEQIYHFILDWARNDDEPTIGKMVKLLWENKHKETVYHMKLLWKKRRQQSVD